MALSNEKVRDVVTDLWRMHLDERLRFDLYRDYVSGRAGGPVIPDDAAGDVKDIAGISRKNVIGVVIDSFSQNLSVVGYRAPTSEVNAKGWRRWQRNRLPARQDEVHRAALTYGTGYAVVTPNRAGLAEVRFRTPRRVLAVYDDPQVDQWPRYALETWVANRDGKKALLGLLLDDEVGYPLNLGEVPISAGTLDTTHRLTGNAAIGEPIPHNAAQCPVVRYVNRRDADDLVVGEVEPLMTLQRAINNVNFDRLTVSRFGAFPQKVISGWAGSKAEVLAASAQRVWAFEEPDVRAQTLMGTDGKGYNDLITEMMEHVAMTAQLSPAQVTGKMVNLSADALAAGEKNQQRKLARLQSSFGESHEDLMRLMADVEDDAEGADDFDSEAVWLDTEARSFAAVVDGVTKLSAEGVPLEDLLSLVPGLTQAQRESIRTKMSAGLDFRSAMANLMPRGGDDATGNPPDAAA